MKKIILLSFSFLTIGIASAQNADISNESSATNNKAQQTLNNVDKQFFIENKGQWPVEVLFLTQMGGLNVWITTKGMWYEFYKTEEIKENSNASQLGRDIVDANELKQYKRWGHRVGFTLIGNNTAVNRQGKQKQNGYYNYLLGNDFSKHASNVGLYKEALVKDVYTGIDMRYYFDKGLLRYDYIVNPGADPSQIRFKIEGSDKTYLNNKNELVFTTCFGEVKNSELYCYQNQDNVPDINARNQVAAKFTKQVIGAWTIALGAYNKNQTLIIDPLIYSTYIGGSGYDYGISIALDASGNAYIAGTTSSTNYDITAGAFQTTIGGGYADIFVTKLNSSGTALIYSTYIGGSDNEEVNSIALDASANAYITGRTVSVNYDVTAGAFQTTYGGGWDIFVTKLNSSGTALIYSTYIGGSSNDWGRSIAIDASANAYITGSTSSIDYDITAGAFQTSYGWGDAYVTKLNASGTALVYSTYIGGSGSDLGNSIALDASANAYITGRTYSTDYDITAGAFQTTNGGVWWDAFVTKLNASGTALIYSTYIGGSSDEEGYSIALDASTNAYITGSTNSIDYDVTAGAFQTTYEGSHDVFVSKLNASGTALIYSTYIGGSNDEGGYSIALDASDNAYITGSTNSIDYDITAGAFQTTIGGVYDAYVTKLNDSGTALIYSTYIGGSQWTSSSAITLDASAYAYITGSTNSIDYDITAGAFQTSYGGGSDDVFVTKLCLGVPSSVVLSSAPSTSNQTVCLNSAITNITYATTGATGATFSGLPAGVTGTWQANVITISGILTLNGTFNYTVTIFGGCSPQSATGTITSLSTIAAGTSQTVCENDIITTISLATTGATGATFSGLPVGVSGSWASNTVLIFGTPYTSGTFNYTVTITGDCPPVTTTGTITVNPIPSAIASYNGNGIITTPSIGTSYQWIDCSTMLETVEFYGFNTPTMTITENGVFAVQVSNEFCASISPCVAVYLVSIEEITKDAIHVYPNPTGEGVTITMSIVSTKIEVIDSQGKLLETLTIGKGISTSSMSGASSTGSVSVVSLANYEPGVYFLRIITEGGTILRRVVKT